MLDDTTLYIFTIETDSYAGNFEREMCAYITGQIAECGVGHKAAAIAKEEMPDAVTEFGKIITEVPGEDNCFPVICGIRPNPRYGNDGMGGQALLTENNKVEFHHPAYNSVVIYFRSKPNDRLLRIMKERAARLPKAGDVWRLYPERLREITIEDFGLAKRTIKYESV